MTRPERFCTVCNAKGQRVLATHVAASATGFEWYECGQHGPDDHGAEFGWRGEQRVGLVTLDDFFRRLPGFED